jgi:hypothetical protein
MGWLSVAKNVAALIVLLVNMINDAQQRGLGRLEATNEALLQAQKDIAYALAIEEDAERGFKQNPNASTDEDKQFEVPDGQ